ncbi:MAG: tRNA preQ1(34) S-adenosylmethionine ribosyltransferase-isomerase QueA [Candidatus Omnitrophica bacterium]|nr:tRNA preQ1(34) S-adenosylmethionine ribosyltransferase-isomerase QueA [Candidatus Omnitrophota bacterium]
MLKLSDFDYSLPKELIAQYPLEERDACRLLVLDRGRKCIEHRVFSQIAGYFNKGDLLVLNDTRVLRSRLEGRRVTGGRVEILLLNSKDGSRFNALIKPGRLRLGEKIIFGQSGITGQVSAKNEVTFNTQDMVSLYNLGVMPLPPYIKRGPEALDDAYYQTIYARCDGAVAAPTAGLHFTEKLLSEIASGGVNTAYITLHVGYGTFRPVKEEDITSHVMEAEYFQVPPQAKDLIEETRRNKKRIFATGTTSCRALEAHAKGQESGQTKIFIYPGYEFKMADCLLTNFHLPRTTLFMLVCAFAGEELAKEAYRQAIEEKYRFYSYGDAMLII